jgi:hypothetical protein
LPYSWQLITLAIWYGSSGADPNGGSVREAVRRWLWLTTYGEVFGGVNSAIYDRSQKALSDVVAGSGWQAMDRDVTDKVRPLQRFDFRSARCRALALAMARHQDDKNLNGAAHRALATGASALGLLMTKGMRSTWWHLAVMRDGDSLPRYREALKRRAAGNPAPSDNELLEGIGVPKHAQGSLDALLAARRSLLEEEERAFVQELGLEWGAPG